MSGPAGGDDLCFLGAAELARRMARRELSPVALVEAHLERIAALEPKLNAFLLVTAERALGAGTLPINPAFSRTQAGRIFLAVEKNGEAWYVNPADFKRYFLGRPADAFAAMQKLGLGIKNADLEKIIARTPNYDLVRIAAAIHERVNAERKKAGYFVERSGSAFRGFIFPAV